MVASCAAEVLPVARKCAATSAGCSSSSVTQGHARAPVSPPSDTVVYIRHSCIHQTQLYIKHSCIILSAFQVFEVFEVFEVLEVSA
jgi:hypothetical protein